MVEGVAEEFATASARLDLEWRRSGGGHRIGLTGEVSGTRYDAGVVGDDADVRLNGSWRAALGRALAADVAGSWWQFRRAALDDFNVDMSRASGRLAWSPTRAWLVTGAARRNWIRFPDRVIVIDTTAVDGDGDITVIPLGTDTEDDDQTEIAVAVTRRVGRAGHLGLEAGYRWSRSNESSVRYEGPQVQARVGRWLAGEVSLGTYVLYQHRRFEPYAAYPEGSPTAVLEHREDDAWQFGFTLERPVGDDVRVVVDGSWLDQHSTVDSYTFDHARISVGVEVTLWRAGSARAFHSGGGTDPLPFVPRASAAGTVFRYPAPAAGGVAVVGDFNAWDPSRTPMARGVDGTWEVVVPLRPGIWRYAFVEDGVWRRPPDAPRYEADGFGGENGVLEVPDAVGVTGTRSSRPTGTKAVGSPDGR